MDIKIEGHEDGLPGEEILVNISILNNSIKRIKLFLSDSLYLFKTLNYELKKGMISKKELAFMVNNFKLKNSLALIFKSRIPRKLQRAFIKVRYYYNENDFKEQKYFIRILKPHIRIQLKRVSNDKLAMNIVKKEAYLPTVIENIEFKAVDHYKKTPIRVNIEKYTLEEFMEVIDDIPPIFDLKNAIKRISINSTNPIKLTMYVQYMDNMNNKYTSNTASLILEPNFIINEKAEKLIQASPIFFARGFDFLLEPLVIA